MYYNSFILGESQTLRLLAKLWAKRFERHPAFEQTRFARKEVAHAIGHWAAPQPLLNMLGLRQNQVKHAA